METSMSLMVPSKSINLSLQSFKPNFPLPSYPVADCCKINGPVMLWPFLPSRILCIDHCNLGETVLDSRQLYKRQAPAFLVGLSGCVHDNLWADMPHLGRGYMI